MKTNFFIKKYLVCIHLSAEKINAYSKFLSTLVKSYNIKTEWNITLASLWHMLGKKKKNSI